MRKSYPGHADRMKGALAATVPAKVDPTAVGRTLVEFVAAPCGQCSLQVLIDPASDGAAVTLTVMDRVRSEVLHRLGSSDLLHPGPTAGRAPAHPPFPVDNGDASASAVDSFPIRSSMGASDSLTDRGRSRVQCVAADAALATEPGKVRFTTRRQD